MATKKHSQQIIFFLECDEEEDKPQENQEENQDFFLRGMKDKKELDDFKEFCERIFEKS